MREAPPLIDADGRDMPGLIPIGITVLAATQDELSRLAAAADDAGVDVVGFPVEGQQTKNYREFLEVVSTVGRAELRYVGLALVGNRKTISKLVGKLPLLGQASS